MPRPARRILRNIVLRSANGFFRMSFAVQHQRSNPCTSSTTRCAGFLFYVRKNAMMSGIVSTKTMNASCSQSTVRNASRHFSAESFAKRTRSPASQTRIFNGWVEDDSELTFRFCRFVNICSEPLVVSVTRLSTNECTGRHRSRPHARRDYAPLPLAEANHGTFHATALCRPLGVARRNHVPSIHSTKFNSGRLFDSRHTNKGLRVPRGASRSSNFSPPCVNFDTRTVLIARL